jgi:hypothetical protein
MPEIITCPDCDRKLRVPDDLIGKKVKCPGCSVMFTAVAGGAPPRAARPAPPPQEHIEDPIEDPSEERRRRRESVVRRDDYDDRPPRRDDYDDRRPRRRDDDYDDRPRSDRRDDDYDDYDDYGPSPRDIREGWQKVCSGLNLNIIGSWIWVGGSIFFALGALIAGLIMGSTLLSVISRAGLGREPTRGQATALGAGGIILVITGGVFALCTLAEIILRVIGYGMCMAVPGLRGTSLKPLAITAFSLAAAEAAFRLFGCVWGFAGGVTSSGMGGMGLMPMGGNVIGILTELLGLAGLIVFLCFGRSAALKAKDRGLAGSLLTVLIVFAAFFVLKWLVTFGMALVFGISIFSAAASQSLSGVTRSLGTIFAVLMTVSGLMYVAYLGIQIWFIFILQRWRDTVQRRLARG